MKETIQNSLLFQDPNPSYTEMGITIQQWRAAIGRGAGKSRKKRKYRKRPVHETLAQKAFQQEASQVQMHYLHRIKVLNTAQLYNVIKKEVQNFTNTSVNMAGAKVAALHHTGHHLILPSFFYCGSPASSAYCYGLS